jgi:hypothetical protein
MLGCNYLIFMLRHSLLSSLIIENLHYLFSIIRLGHELSDQKTTQQLLSQWSTFNRTRPVYRLR